MKKGDFEIDKLAIWIFALLVLIVLIFIVLRYKEKIIYLLTNLGNILRFGGG